MDVVWTADVSASEEGIKLVGESKGWFCKVGESMMGGGDEVLGRVLVWGNGSRGVISLAGVGAGRTLCLVWGSKPE